MFKYLLSSKVVSISFSVLATLIKNFIKLKRAIPMSVNFDSSSERMFQYPAAVAHFENELLNLGNRRKVNQACRSGRLGNFPDDAQQIHLLYAT